MVLRCYINTQGVQAETEKRSQQLAMERAKKQANTYIQIICIFFRNRRSNRYKSLKI